jgi:hypothetical protein
MDLYSYIHHLYIQFSLSFSIKFGFLLHLSFGLLSTLDLPSLYKVLSFRSSALLLLFSTPPALVLLVLLLPSQNSTMSGTWLCCNEDCKSANLTVNAPEKCGACGHGKCDNCTDGPPPPSNPAPVSQHSHYQAYTVPIRMVNQIPPNASLPLRYLCSQSTVNCGGGFPNRGHPRKPDTTMFWTCCNGHLNNGSLMNARCAICGHYRDSCCGGA